ncbi:MAG: class I tRNA ligase family protein, partial [Kiritimatiellia bacterium]|nr:class I tRNA ligase family protein [Lentisphaerota bacterium]
VMRRVPEVLDCWFESGAMPFGQCHYPFENREWFESHFPADFIVEYPGQIRGWFYYLHVLGVALLGRAAFKNCLVHGTLLAEDGAKISKSRRNFTDPMELIDRHGADALRLYLMSSPAVMMEDMNFKDAGVQEQTRRVLLPLWNAYSFFATYANIDGYTGDLQRLPDSTNPLDRWILALLRLTSDRVHEAYRGFHLNQALSPILDFIDDLTNWYIRQSRARFWGGGLTEDKRMAYDTLYYVILNTARLLAPAAPFIADEIFRNLTGALSVHLEAWPEIPANYHDQKLLDQTRLARLVVSLGLALRQRRGIRVRQPLQRLQVVLPPEQRAMLTEDQQAVVCNELNVKMVDLLEDWSNLAELRVSPDARSIGPIWGKTTQRIIRAAKAGQVREAGQKVIVFDRDEQWPLERRQVALNYVGRAGADVMADQGVLVALDCELTPELVEEGIANELNRIIQDMRKQAGYAVSDRVQMDIAGPLPETWRVRLAELALATITDLQEKDADIIKKEDISGKVFKLMIRRIPTPINN